MSDDLLPLPSISHFAVLEPVVRLLAGVSHSRTARTAGCIARNGWSLHERAEQTPAARPAEEDWERAVKPIQRALAGGGVDKVRFTAEVRSTGRTTVGPVWPCPAVEEGAGRLLGVLLLVDGVLPGPWRCWSARSASGSPAPPTPRRRRRSPPPRPARASRCPTN